MSWGFTPMSGYIINKQDIIFPKTTPIYEEWDKDKIVGTATNFKSTDKGVVCDIKLNDGIDYADTVVPAISRLLEAKNQEAKLEYIGLIKEPMDRKIKHNLK